VGIVEAVPASGPRPHCSHPARGVGAEPTSGNRPDHLEPRTKLTGSHPRRRLGERRMSKLLSCRSRIEGIADMVLFFFVTVPLVAILITLPFCSGWNESTGDGTCTLPMLTNFYNGIMMIILIVGLTGPIFFIIPIAMVAVVVSVVSKIRRIAGGYRPQTAFAIISESVFIIPIVVVIVCVSSLFVGQL
jgi:hypothetical protein